MTKIDNLTVPKFFQLNLKIHAFLDRNSLKNARRWQRTPSKLDPNMPKMQLVRGHKISRLTDGPNLIRYNYYYIWGLSSLILRKKSVMGAGWRLLYYFRLNVNRNIYSIPPNIYWLLFHLIWKNYIQYWDFGSKSWIVDFSRFIREKRPQNNFSRHQCRK